MAITPKKAAAALRARDAAMTTPSEVRRAFIGEKRQAAGITLEPFCLGMLYLLQEIDHPFARPPEQEKDEEGQPVFDAKKKPVMKEYPITALDALNAIYIFHDPLAAREALAEHRSIFDAHAFNLSLTIPPFSLEEIARVIGEIMASGTETAPGGGSDGAGNP